MKNPSNDSTGPALQLRKGLHIRQFGLDQGIYDPKEKQVFMLNPTAGLILQYLPTGKSYEEIAQNIAIAFGFSDGEWPQMLSDLHETVQMLRKAELVEEVNEIPPSDIPDDLAITEVDMTRLPMGYLPPEIRRISLEDLKDPEKRRNALFLDVYKNMIPGSHFADTWMPGFQTIRFLDVYKPGMQRPSFSDTWNPAFQTTRFLDVYKPAMQRPSFLDTWKPGQGRVHFLDTWKPGQGRVHFLDTWKPGRGDVSFLDTWKPGNVNEPRADVKFDNPAADDKQG